jgi:hypothetical protein
MYNEEKYFNTNKLLDEVLKTDPGFELSDNFANILAEKMSRKFAWEQYFREFFIYLGAILGLLAVPVVIQYILFDANLQNWLQMVVGNYELIIGAFVLIIFILFTDRVLLRYFMHKSAVAEIV